jgi:hypothetical protein
MGEKEGYEKMEEKTEKGVKTRQDKKKMCKGTEEARKDE